MAAVLFFVVVLFLIIVSQGKSVRESILTTLLLWGVLALLSVETLSLFCSVDYFHLVLFWVVAGLICLGIAITRRSYIRDVFRTVPSTSLTKSDVILLSGLAIILLGTVVAALVAPPNTWDSMTYHMARVAHWVQNKSIGHYPTSIDWQISYPPFAEFSILHTVILAGSDSFANMIQWVAMAGSLIGVSLIAKNLGGDQRLQILSVVFAATIPMAILQASSTQNDQVASFYLVCFVYFGLRTISFNNKQNQTTAALKTGAALGLAILTKGTAYLVAFPFALWFAVVGLRKSRVGFVKLIVLVGTVALVINAGHYWRNHSVYGVFIGSPKITAMESNETVSFNVIVSNLMKNLALNLHTPSEPINAVIKTSLERFHKVIGADINDPRSTFMHIPFKVPLLYLHEDCVGAPFHVVLITFGLILIFVWKRRFTSGIFWYAVCLVAGILLFCSVLRWQPWGVRRQLPFLIVAAPAVTFALSGVINRRTCTAIALFLIIASMPVLLCNSSRPLIGFFHFSPLRFVSDSIFKHSRKDLYFRNLPFLKTPYENAAKYIAAKNPSAVGLKIGWNYWEYPLWILLADLTDRPIVLKHVNVHNVSKRAKTCLELKKPPEIIFATPPAGNKFFLEKYGVGYTKVWSKGHVTLYSIAKY